MRGRDGRESRNEGRRKMGCKKEVSEIEGKESHSGLPALIPHVT